MTTANNHTNIRIIALSAVVLAVMISALGAWFHNAGSALAPEPAKLSVALGSSTGATAAAVYLSGTPTKVLFYSSSWTQQSNGPAAGTPCSSASLATDQVTTHVIATYVVTSGYTYRRCI